MSLYIEQFIEKKYNKDDIMNGHKYHNVHIENLSDKLINDLYLGKLSKEEYNEKTFDKKLVTKLNKKDIKECKKEINKLKKMKHPQDKRMFFSNKKTEIIYLERKEYENYYGRNILVI